MGWSLGFPSERTLAMVEALLVSVVIPCRNEVLTIAQVLADLAVQTLPGPFEVIVADGGSDDGTRSLLEREAAVAGRPYVLQVVDNPRRIIPVALNLAVAAARGTVIIRIDGHCRLAPDYLATIAAALADPETAVVGPRITQLAGGPGWLAQAISALLVSPFGTGGTPSRGRLRQPRVVTHTVMSCFRRTVWERLGGYDERLLSNEDFDFDYRAGLAGFRVISLPEPEFQLIARATLAGLARQRWRYGWWKSVVVRKFPASLHFRQLAPPGALLVFMVLLISAPWVAWLTGAVYLFTCWVAGVVAMRGTSMGGMLTGVVFAPLILSLIHGAWAVGLLAGLVGNRTPVRGEA